MEQFDKAIRVSHRDCAETAQKAVLDLMEMARILNEDSVPGFELLGYRPGAHIDIAGAGRVTQEGNTTIFESGDAAVEWRIGDSGMECAKLLAGSPETLEERQKVINTKLTTLTREKAQLSRPDLAA